MFVGQKDTSKLSLNISDQLLSKSTKLKVSGVTIDNSVKFEARVKRTMQEGQSKSACMWTTENIFRKTLVKVTSIVMYYFFLFNF